MTTVIDDKMAVRVNNPLKLPAWELPAERVQLGSFYKPTLAKLPDGELVLAAFDADAEPLGDGRTHTRNYVWRSGDGGVTWSGPVEAEELWGREQWLTATKEGVLFSTGKLLPSDVRNEEGVQHSYIHRSTDGGRTWERSRVRVEGAGKGARVLPKRNVVEMSDGSLFFGAGIQGELPGLDSWVLRSFDKGETWEQGPKVKIGRYRGEAYHNADAFFTEDFTFLQGPGKLVHFVRCGPPSTMYPMRDGRATPTMDDNGDRTLWCESRDTGVTWGDLADWGDYGQMYVRVLRLEDGRLLATFTQRGVFVPLGLRGVLSYDDGETWRFECDQILIDYRTLCGMSSGGGFGNTVQLADGTLVSCTSYRGWGGGFQVEVVRWRLAGGEARA